MSSSARAVTCGAPQFAFAASVLILIQTAAPQVLAAPPAAPPPPSAPTAQPPTLLPPSPAAPLPEAASRRHLRYAEREVI